VETEWLKASRSDAFNRESGATLTVFLSTAKRGAQVFHQQHEVEFEAGEALKSVLSVKRRGFGVDGVNQDGAAADDLRACVRPSQGVFEQGTAKPLALLCCVNGQAREQHYWDRFWGRLACPSSGFLS
jgi:hypothetical protein